MSEQGQIVNGLEIPDIVIGRLPIYLRTLKQLVNQAREVTSSQELGELLGISSAQIRKDLSHFGEFGKQGTGYNTAFLCSQLEEILKVDCIWPVVLVGAGYLGHALASYNGFENRGFRITAVFDSDSQKIGQEIGSLLVKPIAEVNKWSVRLTARLPSSPCRRWGRKMWRMCWWKRASRVCSVTPRRP